jgi:hypothetical protein
MKALVKYDLDTQVWLVPENLDTEELRSAVHKLVMTKHGCEVPWTAMERVTFREALQHPDVWRPL